MLACTLSAPAGAVTFDDLYTVSVAPDPALSGEQQRTDAIRRGMTDLLTRLTGRRRSANEPGIGALIRNAADYYNVYSPLAGEIRISFLRDQVNDALARLNEPMWPDERPLTLLWLAVDFSDGERAELGSGIGTRGYRPDPDDVVSSEQLSPEAQQVFDAAVEELLDVAAERGLPLVLPRLDGQDRRLVRFADVWGGFDRFVVRAGERYGADAVLIARLGMSETEPELRWILRRGDEVEQFRSAELRAGIDRLADGFASEFTIEGGLQQTWLTIRNIRSWPDYGRVDQYLRSVSIIDDVFVRSWSAGGELLLRIDARGDAGRLQQIFALGGTLVPWVPDSVVAPANPPVANELVFVPQWLRDAEASPESR